MTEATFGSPEGFRSVLISEVDALAMGDRISLMLVVLHANQHYTWHSIQLPTVVSVDWARILSEVIMQLSGDY